MREGKNTSSSDDKKGGMSSDDKKGGMSSDKEMENTNEVMEEGLQEIKEKSPLIEASQETDGGKYCIK